MARRTKPGRRGAQRRIAPARSAAGCFDAGHQVEQAATGVVGQDAGSQRGVGLDGAHAFTRGLARAVGVAASGSSGQG
jgi:hypothetical protein